MKKSELTKKKLYETAIKLFSINGFDGTTMREIAKEAGIAPGAIYYHFPSKEGLVFEYYKHSHNDHLEAIGDGLKNEKSFEKRLMLVVKAKMKVAEPYKDMARALFRVAAHPTSPLSPFSNPSKELVDESMDLFAQVIEGSEDKFQTDIRKLLPQYLWIYQMGVILFWIYDQSEESKRTEDLIEKTVPLISSLNKMMSSPLAGMMRGKIIHILESFNEDILKIKTEKKEDLC